MMLAIASRETNMRNINGDGGHGRGVFQIDDRYHQGFRASAGRRATVREAAMYAAKLIADNMQYAKERAFRRRTGMRVASRATTPAWATRWRVIARAPSTRAPPGTTTSSDVLQRRRKTIATFLPMFVGSIKIGDVGIGEAGGGGGRTIPGPVTDTGAKGPTKTGKGPIRGGTDKIVLQPEKMRSSPRSWTARATRSTRRDAAQDAGEQAHDAAARQDQRPAEIAGVQFRMRTLWREAETWSDELKKRANRIDEPAGSRSKRPGHAKVQRKPVLARGATGPMVKTLQRLLNKLGFGPLDVDGIFGPLTQAAVTRFQKAKKLEADGVVNQKDWATLLGTPRCRPRRRATRHRARARAWAPSS